MEFGFERTGIVPGSDTVSVSAHTKPGAFACTHRIPIDPHDSGYGPAVRFHVGRTVVGFNRNAIIMILVKPGHTGIIPKD
jgi:hypothetical protein